MRAVFLPRRAPSRSRLEPHAPSDAGTPAPREAAQARLRLTDALLRALATRRSTPLQAARAHTKAIPTREGASDPRGGARDPLARSGPRDPPYYRLPVFGLERVFVPRHLVFERAVLESGSVPMPGPSSSRPASSSAIRDPLPPAVRDWTHGRRRRRRGLAVGLRLRGSRLRRGRSLLPSALLSASSSRGLGRSLRLRRSLPPRRSLAFGAGLPSAPPASQQLLRRGFRSLLRRRLFRRLFRSGLCGRLLRCFLGSLRRSLRLRCFPCGLLLCSLLLLSHAVIFLLGRVGHRTARTRRLKAQTQRSFARADSSRPAAPRDLPER